MYVIIPGSHQVLLHSLRPQRPPYTVAAGHPWDVSNWTAGDNCGVDGRPGDPWMTLISCVTLSAHSYAGYPSSTDGSQPAKTGYEPCSPEANDKDVPIVLAGTPDRSELSRAATRHGGRKRWRAQGEERALMRAPAVQKAGRSASPHMRLAATLNRFSFLQFML